MSKKMWSVESNRISALNILAEKLGYSKVEDWYGLTRKDLIENGFGSLIKYYGQSPYQLLIDNFRDFDWKPWLMKNLPRNYWTDDTLCLFFKWLKTELNVSDYADWYVVNTDTLKKHCFHGCLLKSLKIVYPEYDWKPWLFCGTPKGTWQDKNLHKQYFQWLEKELKICHYAEWYNVTLKLLGYYNAGGLISRKYGSSIYRFIKEHLPEHDWKPWLFVTVGSQFWKDKSNHRKYGEWLEGILNIKHSDRWYHVTQQDFATNSGAGLLTCYYQGSPARFVMSIFPELGLDVTKFKNKRKGQSKLFFIVKELFPNDEVLWEFKHDKIRSKRNRKLELDVYVPSKNIAFEYQGAQHYGNNGGEISGMFADFDFDRIAENDKIKLEKCKLLGIKLIRISHTWDETKQYVVSKIADSENDD
jgi:hypothetical protein